MTLPTNLSQSLDKLRVVHVEQTDVLHVFKAKVPYVKYAFGDGREAEFIKEPGSTYGVYYTNQPELIDELNHQIKMRHPLIFVDPAQPTIVAEDRDPKIRQRKQIIADLMAEGWMKTDPSNDMGATIQGNLKVASTTDIAATAAGGDGANDTARLAALAAQLSKTAAKKFVPPVPVTENLKEE